LAVERLHVRGDRAALSMHNLPRLPFDAGHLARRATRAFSTGLEWKNVLPTGNDLGESADAPAERRPRHRPLGDLALKLR
jgi:hypothetical protein